MPVFACTNHNVTTSDQWRSQSYMITRNLAVITHTCRSTLNWHIEFQLSELRLGSSPGKPRCSLLATVCHKVEHRRYSQQSLVSMHVVMAKCLQLSMSLADRRVC